MRCSASSSRRPRGRAVRGQAGAQGRPQRREHPRSGSEGAQPVPTAVRPGVPAGGSDAAAARRRADRARTPGGRQAAAPPGAELPGRGCLYIAPTDRQTT